MVRAWHSRSKNSDKSRRRSRLSLERLEDRLTPALSVTSMTTITETDLVNTILGSGVSVDSSSIRFQGVRGGNSSGGIFTGGTGIIGFESGIILSTGRARDVIGPNTRNQGGGVSTNNQLGGDS